MSILRINDAGRNDPALRGSANRGPLPLRSSQPVVPKDEIAAAREAVASLYDGIEIPLLPGDVAVLAPYVDLCDQSGDVVVIFPVGVSYGGVTWRIPKLYSDFTTLADAAAVYPGIDAAILPPLSRTAVPSRLHKAARRLGAGSTSSSADGELGKNRLHLASFIRALVILCANAVVGRSGATAAHNADAAVSVHGVHPLLYAFLQVPKFVSVAHAATGGGNRDRNAPGTDPLAVRGGTWATDPRAPLAGGRPAQGAGGEGREHSGEAQPPAPTADAGGAVVRGDGDHGLASGGATGGGPWIVPRGDAKDSVVTAAPLGNDRQRRGGGYARLENLEADRRRGVEGEWTDAVTAVQRGMMQQRRQLMRQAQWMTIDAIIDDCTHAGCDDDRMAIVENALVGVLKGKFVLCSSVADILRTFMFEDDKVRTALLFAPIIANGASREIILDCFAYDDDSDNVADKIPLLSSG